MGCAHSLPESPASAQVTPEANGTAHITTPDSRGSKAEEAPCCVITKPLPDAPYTGSCAPLCELQRKKHLDELNILDTEPEQRFDDITKLCCMIFKAPIALVSLVDSERQWFKSVQGLQCSQTDRHSSFCAWTLLPAYPEALVVEDALEDARFKRNPLVVGAPFIRFYAGCPLVCSNGLRLGSLCIIDTRPRKFDAESCSVLANMAEMVVREIEKEKALAAQVAKRNNLEEESQHLLHRAMDSFSDAILLVHPTADDWQVLYSNEPCKRLLGVGAADLHGGNFWSMFELVEGPGATPAPTSPAGRALRATTSSSGQTAAAQFGAAIAEQRNFQLHVMLSGGRGETEGAAEGGAQQHLVVQFRCASNTALDPRMPQIGIPNFLPSGGSGGGPALYFAIIRDPEAQARQQQQQRSAPAFNLTPGVQGAFADIKLGPLLGKGAFGRVYRGMWNGSPVAVKIVEFTSKEWAAGRLLEGLLSENLSHPNVVQTFKHMTWQRPADASMDGAFDALDTGSVNLVANGSCNDAADGGGDGGGGVMMMETWLVLEFCNRGCISDAVDKGWFRVKGSLFEPDICVILTTAAEVASALAYLHSRGILHGDLTGNNVLLTKSAGDRRGWTAKVSDFGLARQLSTEAPVIQTRSYGTVTHMPPELLMKGVMSMAVDVYSWGVVAWEMFMGHRPYSGMSHSQVLHAVSSGKLLQLPLAAPGAFRELVQQALDPEAARRPTFSEIVTRMDQIKADLHIS